MREAPVMIIWLTKDHGERFPKWELKRLFRQLVDEFEGNSVGKFHKLLLQRHSTTSQMLISIKENVAWNLISFLFVQQSDHSDGGPVRKKSILQNPLTLQQQQQQLQQVQHTEPVVIQPTLNSAPAIIPHLQSIYGLFSFPIVLVLFFVSSFAPQAMERRED